MRDRTNTCWHCPRELEPLRDPVTVSGWYDGRLFQWRSGKLDLDDVRCPQCRDRAPL
jgi:hypothetical protein